MTANLQPLAWDDLRFFLAVHRHGSHKAAGSALSVDATTVGRRLQSLESALGVKLVQRTPERLLMTRSGLALVARAERVEAEIFALERELKGAQTELQGSLRVTAGDGTLHYLLLPALLALRNSHPELQLELRADTRSLDLSRREADVALRLVRPKEPALVARRLGEVRFAIFASDEYLRTRPAPRNVQALAQHDWIGFDPKHDDLPHIRAFHRTVKQPRYVLRANTTTTQVLACLEGIGLALVPALIGLREPRLRPVLPRWAGPVRDLWAVTHADLRDNLQVRAFLSWVAPLLAAATAQ